MATMRTIKKQSVKYPRNHGLYAPLVNRCLISVSGCGDNTTFVFVCNLCLKMELNNSNDTEVLLL